MDAVLDLYDRQCRRGMTVDVPGYRVDRSPTIVRLVGPTPAASDNCVLWSRLDPGVADRAIDAECAYFDDLGHAFEWKLHDYDAPPDLARRLADRGFAAAPEELVMVLDPAALGTIAPPAGVDIVRLDASAPLDDVAAVKAAVWGQEDDGLIGALAAERAADPRSLDILVAYAEGRPVSVGWIRYHAGTDFASMWGGATLPAFRRRGIYRALVGRRAADARARGARHLTVDAGPESRPILARLGFRPLAAVTPFVRRPGGEPRA